MNIQMIGPLFGTALALGLLALASVGLTFGTGEIGSALLMSGLAMLLLVLSIRAWPARVSAATKNKIK